MGVVNAEGRDRPAIRVTDRMEEAGLRVLRASGVLDYPGIADRSLIRKIIAAALWVDGRDVC